MASETPIKTYDAEAVNAKERRELYVKRQKIHPKRVKGTFRTLKWWIMVVTLGIYYGTPWLRWDRGPYAPDQAVLVDLANRRFYFFFIEIWPHEFFYVAGLLVMAGIALFLITSTVGRAWCGYMCPQTVWVDLFLVVERWVEGDRNARIKLDKAQFSISKLIKRVAKHSIWLFIAVATGGAWIFYFADAPTLARQFITGEAHPIAYSTVAVLTATTYVLGGLMREQVCTYMCPWPRIQAAMLDEHSLVVTYNDWRGEPRSRHIKKENAEHDRLGDCVDCNACVAVCPMGIDIRDGQQLECITCALCIDACDGVMQKLGRENGLISYTTLNNYNHNMAIATGGVAGGPVQPQRVRGQTGAFLKGLAHFNWRDTFRLRTWIYIGVYSLIGLAMLGVLMTRDRLDAYVLHDRNPIFVRLSDGSIRNGYQLKILNMKAKPRAFDVRIEGLQWGALRVNGVDTDQGGGVVIRVPPDQLLNVKAFVTQPPEEIKDEQSDFSFVVRELAGEEVVEVSARFEAPEDRVTKGRGVQ